MGGPARSRLWSLPLAMWRRSDSSKPALRGAPGAPALAALLAAGVLLAGLVPAASASVVAQAPRGPVTDVAPAAATASLDTALADRLASLINDLRRDVGRRPVVVDTDRMGAVAAVRVRDMMASHQIAPSATTDGKTIEDLMTGQGVRWLAGGEVVTWATGAVGTDPLNAIVVQLLSKPSYRSLILASRATDIGVAIGILDGASTMKLAGSRNRTVAAAPRIAIASIVLIEKDGPAAPRLAFDAHTVRSGSGAGVRVTADGPGRLSVALTGAQGDLLAVVVWDRPVSGPVDLRWDGTVNGKPAPPGTYQVRAFTVDSKGRASNPSFAEITVTR
jgi:uncharacterized protein YkwD